MSPAGPHTHSITIVTVFEVTPGGLTALTVNFAATKRFDVFDIDRGARKIEVVHFLQVQPELRCHPKSLPDPQRRVRRDRPGVRGRSR